MIRIKGIDCFYKVDIKTEKNPRYLNDTYVTGDKMEIHNLIFSMMSGLKEFPFIYIAKENDDIDRYYVVEGNRRFMVMHLLFICRNEKQVTDFANKYSLKITNSVLKMILDFHGKGMTLEEYIGNTEFQLCETQEEITSVYLETSQEDNLKLPWKTINKYVNMLQRGIEIEEVRTKMTLAIFEAFDSESLSEEVLNKYSIDLDDMYKNFKKRPTAYALYFLDFISNKIDTRIRDNSEYKKVVSNLSDLRYLQNSPPHKIMFDKFDVVETHLLCLLYIAHCEKVWTNTTFGMMNILTNFNRPICIDFLNRFEFVQPEKDINKINVSDIPDSIIINDQLHNFSNDTKRSICYENERKRNTNVLMFIHASDDDIMLDFIINEILIGDVNVDPENEIFYVDSRGKDYIPKKIEENFTIEDDNIIFKYIRETYCKRNTLKIYCLSYPMLLKEYPLLETGYAWITNFGINSSDKFDDDNFNHQKICLTNFESRHRFELFEPIDSINPSTAERDSEIIPYFKLENNSIKIFPEEYQYGDLTSFTKFIRDINKMIEYLNQSRDEDSKLSQYVVNPDTKNFIIKLWNEYYNHIVYDYDLYVEISDKLHLNK